MASTPAYIQCPHCKKRMRTHTHVTFGPLLKQLTASCHNPECLFTAKINVEIAKQLQPSLSPNPEIEGKLIRKGHHDDNQSTRTSAT